MPWLEDLKFPRGYQMGTHKQYKTIYNNTTYFFCNEVVNDEPTSKYKIYKEIGEEFIEETNRTILEEIIEDFNEQIEVRIRDFRNSIGME